GDDRPAPPVRRIAAERGAELRPTASGGRAGVVGGGILVAHQRDAGAAPSLADAQRHPRIGMRLTVRGAGRIVTDRHCRRGQVGNRTEAPVVGTDVQGPAAAELPGVGDLVDTGGAGGGVDQTGVERAEARVTDAAFVVDERSRTTEGEAAPLDERTGRL